MATNWTFESAASIAGHSSTASTTTGFLTPLVGDLMVTSIRNSSATTTATSLTITDTAIAGDGAAWNPIIGSALSTAGGVAVLQGWWKIANVVDATFGATNSFIVTGTAVGGTGAQVTDVQCDILRVPE